MRIFGFAQERTARPADDKTTTNPYIVLDILIRILQLLLSLTILVTIHELGHYLASALLGGKCRWKQEMFQPYNLRQFLGYALPAMNLHDGKLEVEIGSIVALRQQQLGSVAS